MRPVALPDPEQLRQTPERGALVLLLAALDLADSALRIEHPALHCDPAPRPPGLPASELLAELLLARFAELTAPACASGPYVYERRRPESTTLHRVVRENLLTLYAAVEQGFASPLPKVVKDELEAARRVRARFNEVSPCFSARPARSGGSYVLPP